MEAQASGTSPPGAPPAQRSSLGSNKPPAKKLTISLKKGLARASPARASRCARVRVEWRCSCGRVHGHRRCRSMAHCSGGCGCHHQAQARCGSPLSQVAGLCCTRDRVDETERPKLPETFEADTWTKLQASVRAVHQQRPVDQSFEELYKVVVPSPCSVRAPNVCRACACICSTFTHVGVCIHMHVYVRAGRCAHVCLCVGLPAQTHARSHARRPSSAAAARVDAHTRTHTRPSLGASRGGSVASPSEADVC